MSRKPRVLCPVCSEPLAGNPIPFDPFEPSAGDDERQALAANCPNYDDHGGDWSRCDWCLQFLPEGVSCDCVDAAGTTRGGEPVPSTYRAAGGLPKRKYSWVDQSFGRGVGTLKLVHTLANSFDAQLAAMDLQIRQLRSSLGTKYVHNISAHEIYRVDEMLTDFGRSTDSTRMCELLKPMHKTDAGLCLRVLERLGRFKFKRGITAKQAQRVDDVLRVLSLEFED